MEYKLINKHFFENSLLKPIKNISVSIKHYACQSIGLNIIRIIY